MRVAIVSRIYRPEPAAAAFFLGSTADALLAHGHEVDVVTVKPPKGLRTASRRERVRTFPVLRDRNGYVRGYVQYLSFDLPLLFRLLVLRRPDVVFVEPPPTTGAVVRLVCALRRIPYVYDAADIWSDAAIQATDSRFVLRALRAIECFAMRGAAAHVTISQGVIERVRALGVDRPMTVTGFGADTSEFGFTPAEPQRLFVYAGTYSRLHGAEVLVEAFARLLRTHPEYTLRFLGNGTEREQLQRRSEELGIAEAVEFIDSVPAAALKEQLAGAVASLATLLPDGGYDYAFTSKVYSSLAVGCPVIFAGPGPTSRFVEEASEHVPVGRAVPYDADEVAQAMRDAADRPLTVKQRRAVAEWTHAEHSMSSVAQRVAGVIEMTARAPRP